MGTLGGTQVEGPTQEIISRGGGPKLGGKKFWRPSAGGPAGRQPPPPESEEFWQISSKFSIQN
jgi:hypothetical protein